MALIIFRSRAASEIIMFARDAETLLAILGKPLAERGVLRAADLPNAIQALESAIAAQAPGTGPTSADADTATQVPIALRQRAFPLLQMLRASVQRDVDVTWGI
jgi:hypothetical protein